MSKETSREAEVRKLYEKQVYQNEVDQANAITFARISDHLARLARAAEWYKKRLIHKYD